MQAPSSEAWLESFKLLRNCSSWLFSPLLRRLRDWFSSFVGRITQNAGEVYEGVKNRGIVKDNLQGLFTSPLPLPTPGYLLTECMYSDGIVCINKQLRVLVTLVI